MVQLASGDRMDLYFASVVSSDHSVRSLLSREIIVFIDRIGSSLKLLDPFDRWAGAVGPPDICSRKPDTPGRTRTCDIRLRRPGAMPLVKPDSCQMRPRCDLRLRPRPRGPSLPGPAARKRRCNPWGSNAADLPGCLRSQEGNCVPSSNGSRLRQQIRVASRAARLFGPALDSRDCQSRCFRARPAAATRFD